MGVSLTACGRESVETPGGELENGVAAIEDAMTTKPSENSSSLTEPIDDLRDGSSADTVATPDDFPAAYNYGSGKISGYSRTAMLQKMPEPAGNDTVLNGSAVFQHARYRQDHEGRCSGGDLPPGRQHSDL